MAILTCADLSETGAGDILLEAINENTTKNSIFSNIKPEYPKYDNTGVTVTPLGTNNALTNQIRVKDNIPDLFSPTGYLELIPYFTSGIRFKTVTVDGAGNVGVGSACAGVGVDFMTDAQDFIVEITACEFNIAVDDVLVQSENFVVSGGGFLTALVEFTTKKPRKITIYSNSSAFTIADIRILPTDTIWGSLKTKEKIMCIGDSFSTGTISDYAGQYWSFLIPKWMGQNNFLINGIGGTGFVNNSANLNYIERVEDVNTYQPDTIIVSASVNDISHVATVGANFTQWLSLVRGYVPNATIVVIGAPATATTGGIDMENALFASVELAQSSDDKLYYIRSQSIDNPPVVGDGDQGSPSGTGNADIYIDADGLHYTGEGQKYWAMWIADRLKNVLY